MGGLFDLTWPAKNGSSTSEIWCCPWIKRKPTGILCSLMQLNLMVCHLLSGAKHQTISLMVMNTEKVTIAGQLHHTVAGDFVQSGPYCSLVFGGSAWVLESWANLWEYKYTFDMWWIECVHSWLLFDKCQITQGAWIPRYTNLGGVYTVTPVTPPLMGGRRYPFLCIVEFSAIYHMIFLLKSETSLWTIVQGMS